MRSSALADRQGECPEIVNMNQKIGLDNDFEHSEAAHRNIRNEIENCAQLSETFIKQ